MLKINMFGFKGGAGYQLDRNTEKLYQRYQLRGELNDRIKNNALPKKHLDNKANFDSYLNSSLRKKM